MRKSIIAPWILLPLICVSACSETGQPPRPPRVTGVSSKLGGITVDAEGYELENPDPREDGGDDMTIFSFGKPADAKDTQAITEVANRYYRAAAAGDGATGCALTLASLARTLPEDFGRPPGPVYMRGSTCATVMSKLFDHSHRELTGLVEVVAVRVKGNEGLALLRSRTLRWAYTRLQRERGVWRFTKLIGAALP
jgi:hypothetical protein